ncbi:MAG: M24 family metallopeptidase [Thermoanaerobaculia bacterium]
MLADLDRLMGEHDLAAILVPLHELMHPGFRWLARGARVTRGWAIRGNGRTILVHDPMERDEAASTGLALLSTVELGQSEILSREADAAVAMAELVERMLEAAGVRGTIGIEGPLPFPLYLRVTEALERRGGRVWRGEEDLISRARKRKDAREIAAVASVGRRTEQVVTGVRSMLRDASIRDGLLEIGGDPLTIGSLKDFIRREIDRLGMIEDHETIVSQGRDAGVPHSRGDRGAVVRASSPLVIDIFPADRETGYFFDLTRTFCVGDVPAKLRELHAQVLEAFELARDAMRGGELAALSQARVCDYFEARAHPTGRSHPGTTAGYVHGLGHGVGLEVHERPSFSLAKGNRDLIDPGDVLTIEPGLYYPEEELGVRIEDTLSIDDEGRAVSFCSSARGLEIA